MKNNTSILPLCLFLLGFSGLKAQHVDWSFHADIGLSQIFINREFTQPDEDVLYLNTTGYKNFPSLSFSYGAIGELKLNKNLSLSSGLSILKMRGIHEVINQGLILIDGSASHREYTAQHEDQSLNFALPLALKYKLNKLNVKLGVQALYLLKGKTNTKTTITADGSTQTIGESNKDVLFKKFDYGLISGLSYRFHKHFSIDANLYWGLNNIIESSFRSNNVYKYIRKNQRISLGVSYYIDGQNN